MRNYMVSTILHVEGKQVPYWLVTIMGKVMATDDRNKARSFQTLNGAQQAANQYRVQLVARGLIEVANMVMFTFHEITAE